MTTVYFKNPLVEKMKSTRGVEDVVALAAAPAFRHSVHVPLPKYLQQTYWWAYLHPAAVRLFERQWLINLILWGNFARLRDAALQEITPAFEGKILQVACVYGDLTRRMMQKMGPKGRLDVVDVLPVQLKNLSAKLDRDSRIALHHQDSTNLRFADGSYDRVVVFFLLHEQPDDVRLQTISQALRVTKRGGKVIFVDYHEPRRRNPFRYVMVPILKFLEPYALDMWRNQIADWIPRNVHPAAIEKQTFFGGLYQKVVITL
jgi:ubiquinone/menaquinone biosynthesis C-methylase UbiE